jgi:hypothetical protein
MKRNEFLLDKLPKFGDGKVTIGKTSYELRMVQDGNCGGILTVWENGLAKDQICLSLMDMKGIYLLLSSKSE